MIKSLPGKIIPLFLILLLASCAAHKKIPYLVDAETLEKQQLSAAAMNYKARFMPGDVISITVNTPSGEAAADFNLPLVPTQSYSVLQTSVTGASATHGSLQNYIVDEEGYINFPVLGRIKIGGMTKQEAGNMIFSKIYPAYLTEIPIVNIRFLNYKVSVLGEVARPDVYTSESEQITLFDALALAGDLTIYGDRRNVLLIRESPEGERSVQRINLQDKNLLLDNDIYYLKQNDVIYVQPNRTKGNNSSFGTMESWMLSGVSILISIIAILVR